MVNEKELDKGIVTPIPSIFNEPVKGAQAHRVACMICGKTFRSKSSMEHHKETAHLEMEGHGF